MKNLEQHGPWWLDTSWWCRCSSLQECSRRSGPRTCTGTSSPFASAARWSLCRGSSAWLSGKQQTLRPRHRPTLSRGSVVHRSDEMFTQGKSYLGWLRGGPIRTHLLREKAKRKAIHLHVTPLAVVVRMASRRSIFVAFKEFVICGVTVREVENYWTAESKEVAQAPAWAFKLKPPFMTWLFGSREKRKTMWQDRQGEIVVSDYPLCE